MVAAPVGWWLLPLLVTLLGCVWVVSHRPSGPFDFGAALKLVGAIIASLTAWLIWALVF